MKKLIPTLLLCVLFTTGTFAGGFQINEHGARAMGMAGAFTGLANDPSAIFFNPAGLVQLKGTQVYFGSTIIVPTVDFRGPNPYGSGYVSKAMENQVFSPINFYLTHQFSDKLSVGVGVNNPYGLGTKWDDSWVGRYLAVETDLKTFFVTPVIAYKFSDQVSVSVGAVWAYGDVTIDRKSPLKDPVTQAVKPDAKVSMSGDGTAFGFTAGMLFKLSECFNIGLSYRSEVSFDFDGTLATIPKTLGFVHPLAGPMSITLPAGNITAKLSTPQNITIGFALMPSKDLTVTADFQYVGWSSYDKLEVTANDFYFDPPTNKVTVSSTDRKYKNTFIARAGFEFTLTETSKFRGGLFYDKNPVSTEYVEPTLPDADRIGFNIGYGYQFSENFGLDLAYMLLVFQERNVLGSKFNFNGTYTNLAHLFAANFHLTL